MGLFDTFKSNKYKKQLETATARIEELEALLTPEAQEILSIQEKIRQLESQKGVLDSEISTLQQLKQEHEQTVTDLNQTIKEKQQQIVTFDDAILVQDFGLYEPRFDFANSTQFKDRLKECRNEQKIWIKRINRASAAPVWTVNGSAAKGRKMVKEITRLLMRAYNGECDEIVRKVKVTNVDRSIKQVYKTGMAINKLGGTLEISIPLSYMQLKEDEVRLAFEFAQQKEKEKEALREARALKREEQKLAQEIAAERRRLEKERKQYLAAYSEIVNRLKTAHDDERAALEERASELKSKLDDVNAAVANVDYREANKRAGFVYIISNIGSFGEGVYKIGMTRRLNPMERIRELSGASVPFNFDVHAMIFSDDAPALETTLHREFENKKINIVNKRREFFRVSLEEIEEVVKRNYDKTVEFTVIPEAGQFRTSEELRKQGIYTAR